MGAGGGFGVRGEGVVVGRGEGVRGEGVEAEGVGGGVGCGEGIEVEGVGLAIAIGLCGGVRWF